MAHQSQPERGDLRLNASAADPADIEELRRELQAERERVGKLERQFRQLAAYLPVGIWMSNRDRKLQFTTGDWMEADEAAGGDGMPKWVQNIHPDDRERVLASMDESFERREHAALEYRAGRRDGSYAAVLNIAAPRFDESGAFDGYAGAVVDITERRRALDALRAAQERLSLALESTHIGVWDWDIVSGEVWMSASAVAIHGYPPEDLCMQASAIAEFVHVEDLDAWNASIRRVLRGEADLVDEEHRVRSKTGAWIWVHERARVVSRNEEGRALRMIGTRRDTTEQRETDARIRWLALHDVLTGLPNRAAFDEALARCVDEVRRDGGRLGLLLIDIDHFKRVNDEHGHDAGDGVLAEIANCLSSALPAPTLVARLGGDEFAALVPNLSGETELRRLAQQTVARCGNSRTRTTISVGGALYPDHASTLSALKKAADTALYTAKMDGRGRAGLFAPAAGEGGGR